MDTVVKSGFSTWWTVKSLWEDELLHNVKLVGEKISLVPKEQANLITHVQNSLSNFYSGKIQEHRDIMRSENILTVRRF